MKTLQGVFDGDGSLSSEELSALEILSAGPITDGIEQDLKDGETRATIDQEIFKYLQYDESPKESKNYVYGLYCDMLEKVGEETFTMEEFISRTSKLLVDTLEEDAFFPENISLTEWARA